MAKKSEKYESTTDFPFPDFPAVMKIGKREALGCSVKILKESSTFGLLQDGDALIELCQGGLRIMQGFDSINIHASQIIYASATTKEEVVQKSVIGRAAVGTLLFGPLGGVVGGMSGLGTKLKDFYLLSLFFFDVYKHTTQTLLMVSKHDLKEFADKLNSKKSAPVDCDDKNYICNLRDLEGNLYETRIKECIKAVGEKTVVQELVNCGRLKSWAKDKVESLSTGRDINEIKEESKRREKYRGIVYAVIAWIVVLAVIFIALQKCGVI